jgi:hypothetical protein
MAACSAQLPAERDPARLTAREPIDLLVRGEVAPLKASRNRPATGFLSANGFLSAEPSATPNASSLAFYTKKALVSMSSLLVCPSANFSTDGWLTMQSTRFRRKHGHIRPAFGSYLLPKLSPLHIQAFYSSSLERGGKDGRVAEGPWYRPSIDAFRDHGGGWRSAS